MCPDAQPRMPWPEGEPAEGWGRALMAATYLFVSFQLLKEGALME